MLQSGNKMLQSVMPGIKLIIFLFFIGHICFAGTARYGYVNHTDVVITHPMMKFWDNEKNAFQDTRGRKKLSSQEIVTREKLYYKLKTIREEKAGIIPLMTLIRNEWQAENPNFTTPMFIQANKEFEKIYEEKVKLNKQALSQVYEEMQKLGWSEKDLLLNRGKSPEKVLAQIETDIQKICADLCKSYNLEAVFNSEGLNNNSGPGSQGISSDTSLSTHYSSLFYSCLNQNLKISDSPGTAGPFNRQNLLRWYRSRDFILRTHKNLNPERLIIKNGIDLTSTVISKIRELYPKNDLNKKKPLLK